MKRPYLTQQQRLLISIGTLQGDCFMLNLAVKRLQRDVYKESGFLALLRINKYIVNYLNYKLFSK